MIATTVLYNHSDPNSQPAIQFVFSRIVLNLKSWFQILGMTVKQCQIILSANPIYWQNYSWLNLLSTERSNFQIENLNFDFTWRHSLTVTFWQCTKILRLEKANWQQYCSFVYRH